MRARRPGPEGIWQKKVHSASERCMCRHMQEKFFCLRQTLAKLSEIAEMHLHRICTFRPRAVSLCGALSEGSYIAEVYAEVLARIIVGCAWEATALD